MMTYWKRTMQWDWEWGDWERIPRGTYEDLLPTITRSGGWGTAGKPYIQLKEVDEKDLVPP